MFSLLSVTRQRSVEYWEGWQAVELHRQCTYTDPQQRKEWARGFADGVAEERGNKAWYKSRTMIVGLGLLLAGVGLVIYGTYFSGGSSGGVVSSTGPFMAGAGSGLTASSIIMSALRLITNSGVSLGGGQYTPPMP